MPVLSNEEQLIFYCAVPGTGWAKLSLLLGCCTKFNLNNTDRCPEREEIGKHGVPDCVHHKGAFWDPGMEFGEGFDDIGANYTKEEFIQECLRPFTEHDDRNYLIRCHHFAETRNLEWLTTNFPNNKIIFVIREIKKCYEGWNAGMTFRGNYPKYTHWMRFTFIDQHEENFKKFWGLLLRHNKMIRTFLFDHDDVIDIIQPNKKFLNKLGYVWDDEGKEEYEKLMMVHQFFKSDTPMYDAQFAFYNCGDII